MTTRLADKDKTVYTGPDPATVERCTYKGTKGGVGHDSRLGTPEQQQLQQEQSIAKQMVRCCPLGDKIFESSYYLDPELGNLPNSSISVTTSKYPKADRAPKGNLSGKENSAAAAGQADRAPKGNLSR
ncbi:hypothetical protein R1flu_021319 [Riccia fluitans]|uniref:Uncharacterized protein n=1 Tax=Riccia fluitans TaxID=41844 RepID=A0ABD1ZP16_9MARC